MPYGHLIAATVMTLGVFQGHSSIASFFSILTSALCHSRAFCFPDFNFDFFSTSQEIGWEDIFDMTYFVSCGR